MEQHPMAQGEIFFLHNNARSHEAKGIKAVLQELEWEMLLYLLFGPLADGLLTFFITYE